MQQLPRLSVKEMWNETLRFFNFEKGLPYTYVSLLKHPLETVKTYLNLNRRKYFNPLNYVLIGVGLYTLILSVHRSFQSFIRDSQEKNAEGYAALEKQMNIAIAEPFARAQEILLSYQNVFYLIVIPVISLITFRLFRKKYNYAENLAINAFVFGTSTWTVIIPAVLTIYMDKPILFFTAMPFISFVIIVYLYQKILQTTWLKAIGTTILVHFVTLVLSVIAQLVLTLFFMT